MPLSRQLPDATDRGCLINLETRRGRPADRPRRSDPGNGEAASRTRRVGCVTRCCTVAVFRDGLKVAGVWYSIKKEGTPASSRIFQAQDRAIDDCRGASLCCHMPLRTKKSAASTRALSRHRQLAQWPHQSGARNLQRACDGPFQRKRSAARAIRDATADWPFARPDGDVRRSRHALSSSMSA